MQRALVGRRRRRLAAFGLLGCFAACAPAKAKPVVEPSATEPPFAETSNDSSSGPSYRVPSDNSAPDLSFSHLGAGSDLPTATDWRQEGREPYRPVFHGTLSAREVEATVRSHSGAFHACALVGTAVVRVIVGGSGQVQDATLFRDHLREGDGKCLLRVISAMHFSPPDETAELLVPFVFRPKAKGP